MNYVRRFVFVHYEDLLEVRFRQLEKVTDKLYVFVPSAVSEVPFWLVRQMQDMGRDLAWVDVGDADYACAQTLLAFHAGTLHEQVDPGVEFAILSDAEGLDALVAYVQAAGRSCVRVKRRPRSTETPSGKTAGRPDATGDDDPEEGAPNELDASHVAGAGRDDSRRNGSVSGDPSAPRANSTADSPPEARRTTDRDEAFELDTLDVEDLDAEDLDRPTAVAARDEAEVDRLFGRLSEAPTPPAQRGSGADVDAPAKRRGMREPLDRRSQADPATVTPLAEHIVRKLVRSGNRPADLPLLRSYILLHGPDASAGRYVDDIIDVMAEKGEIEVSGETVRYGF